MKEESRVPIGRFAPSPTGRMHLGNIFTALLSWLSVKSRAGRWILRIEDLDPQRSSLDHALWIEDDLAWLDLEADEGGVEDKGPNGPYRQSLRGTIYAEALGKLAATGWTYPCRCTRASLHAVNAPHLSDGRMVYPGVCRPADLPHPGAVPEDGASVRLYVPDREIVYMDGLFGEQRVNLAHDCGDFVVRRADGAWAYQLAVVADDALMGVTEVMRGWDLLLSAAQQIYLQELLGYPNPEYVHLPLVCNADGLRLSKRDRGLNMESLRKTHTRGQLLGRLACMAGLIPEPDSCTPADLLGVYDRDKLIKSEKIITTNV